MADKKKEADVFFVEMKEPLYVRKGILESMKEIIHFLQEYERFKQVKADKEKYIADLKKVINDLNSLVTKLKTELPKKQMKDLPEELKKTIMLKKKEKKKKAKAECVVKEELPEPEQPKRSEVDKLEDELVAIEQKLSRLQK